VRFWLFPNKDSRDVVPARSRSQSDAQAYPIWKAMDYMDIGNFISSALSNFLGTVFGGLLLTFLFFVGKEKLFPLPRVAGRWHFETRTRKTAYKPFAGMVLRYVAMVWQQGPVIHGTIEKIYEKSSTGEREYSGAARTRGTVEGFIEKRYLSRDRLQIHIIEEGQERQSSVFFDLLSDGKPEMTGVFESMAADQSGTVKWSREDL
jgi:hypothetical protein